MTQWGENKKSCVPIYDFLIPNLWVTTVYLLLRPSTFGHYRKYSRVGTYTRKRNLGLKKKITWLKSHLSWGNSTDYDDTNLLFLNATWQGRRRFLPTSFDAASQNKSLKVVDDLCNFEMSTKVKMTLSALHFITWATFFQKILGKKRMIHGGLQ